jgi:hypothetical protein
MTEELQGGDAAGRCHAEMLPAARGYDKAFCCGHVAVLSCSGMRIKRRRFDLSGRGLNALIRASAPYYKEESEVERFVGAASG